MQLLHIAFTVKHQNWLIFGLVKSKNQSISININSINRLSKLEVLSIRYVGDAMKMKCLQFARKISFEILNGFYCNSDSYRKIKKTAFNRGNRENSKVKLHLPFVFTTDVFPIWRGYERWHHFQLLQKY